MLQDIIKLGPSNTSIGFEAMNGVTVIRHSNKTAVVGYQSLYSVTTGDKKCSRL